MKNKRMSYFDFVFEAREKGDGWVSSFDDFAHWGYWERPEKARGTLEELQPSMLRLNAEILRTSRLQDGMSVADVGCGFGGTLRQLDAWHQGMQMHGVDPTIG